MKILPTMEGGLRVDAEDESDWDVLEGIPLDALACDESLGRRLGNLVTDAEVSADWREFIVPDLDAAFHTDLSEVTKTIQSARHDAGGGPGPLWITRDDGFQWYSALNQARLAIEERFRFGPSEEIDPDDLDIAARSAFLRSQFYCAVQSLLLDRVLR